MADNELWKKLIRVSTLNHAWHLVRADIQNDFLNYQFYAEAFTTNIDQNFRELAKRIKTTAYKGRK